VFVDGSDDLSCRSKRKRRKWRDGAESLRNESLVSEQLHLVETEIETEGGIETIGLALARRPHPIVPRHIHGQGHEAENLVAARHQEAVRIQIKYDRRAETVVDDHIPGESLCAGHEPKCICSCS